MLTLAMPDRQARYRALNTLLRSGTWREVVAGKTVLSVQFDPLRFASLEAVKTCLWQELNTPYELDQSSANEIEIPICCDLDLAPDLAFISDKLGLSPHAVIEKHIATSYQVDLIGFTPGFAYLEGAGWASDVPRLTRPRQSVPAGSVGLAAGQCGLYALEGPGGWPLIGRTPRRLFNPQDQNPFQLHLGQSVRFRLITRDDYRIAKANTKAKAKP